MTMTGDEQGGANRRAGRRSNDPAAPSIAGFPVVGVGASAGGLESFIELLRHAPPGSGVAFVLIQHLDPTHPSFLSDALARSTGFAVHEIADGMQVEADQVYVIPSNADVGILHGTLTLVPRPADERKPHLPIDFFFEALASDLGDRAIGVVLSGMGSDGTQGLRAIKAAGGTTFAQEPKTAKFSGMPEAAVRSGAVDFSLPIASLAQELVRVGRYPLLRGAAMDAGTTPEDEAALNKIFLLVRSAAGVDFSEYKLASIRRRLSRRMALRGVPTLAEYVRVLREEPTEPRLLFEDVLIHVTSFFRDGAAIEQLKEKVFPEVLRKRQSGGAVRIWSAGCSTGEETYSVLIALLEFLAEQNAEEVPVQVFGTDISERAIETARGAVYSGETLRAVSAERLGRFFTKVDGGGYRINKPVRDRCAFVKHDLARDPPFSKLDLICCRNVLIYFGAELQKRLLATFHFSLNEPGFLLLGRAENIPDGSDLFRLVDKENKVFSRSAVKSALHLTPVREASAVVQPHVAARAPAATDVVRRSESLLLDQYAPPGVIVNGRMEILHFRGRTAPYLEPAPGQPQHDLVKMAKRGLLADLRLGISQARQERAAVRRAGVHVDEDGSSLICDVVVLPVLLAPESPDEVFAVLFEEHAPQAVATSVAPGVPTLPMSAGEQREPRLLRLEQELAATKGYLQSNIEEQQRVNEELLSTNEELVSSNEELQSLNEELQTAKEELQSTNEELATLNEELHTRNVELNTVNSDLLNILASVEVPIVIVDRARRIRRFTPKARPILNLLPADVGRPIDDIKPTVRVESLDQKIADVIETVTVHEEEVSDREGRWFRLQIRPYTTMEKRIDGAVVSIVDIDQLKRALGAAEWARDYARATIEAVHVPFVVFDEALVAVSANGAFQAHYGVSSDAVVGRRLRDILGGALDVADLVAALEGVRQHEHAFQGLELTRELPQLGTRSLSVSGRSVSLPDRTRMILLAIDDITDRRRSENERTDLLRRTQAAQASAEEANRTKDLFLATLSHELRTPLTSLLLSSRRLQMGKLDEEKLRKTAESIERATKAQAQLIDDLLDISRIVTGKLKMELQSLSLASVVKAAVATLGPDAETKQLDLQLSVDDTLPPVSGDPMRLRQVVSNLLTNAIKFTPERGRITVTVDAWEGRGRIRVADTGIGIEPNFLPQLFTRFSQEARGETRAHGGLGLGLAIVRYLVEAQGGTVQAESPGRGKGTVFTVCMPLMPQHALRAEPAEERSDGAADNLKGVRILVVEDDAGTRGALTEMLTLSGAIVRPAASAGEAFALFETFHPELLLCDIAMPEEDGYSLLRRLRALGPERGGDVRALALTALAGEEDQRRALEAGFQLHLAKPVDTDRLVTTLGRLRATAGA